MATEMIKGAEYIYRGVRYVFVSKLRRNPGWGKFALASGITIPLEFSVVVPAPTPFPEPERWAQHEGWVDFVKFSSKESKGFCAASEIGSASAVKQHNAEIDRLMREIRRLEALVESGGAK
jgi:hypothetical protein